MKHKTEVSSFVFYEVLGKVLNFDPSRVHNLTVRAAAGDIVRIEIEFIPTGDQLLNLDWSPLKPKDKPDGA